MALAVYQRLKKHSPYLSKMDFLFGVLWVGLVITSGMISNTGLNNVIEVGINDPDKALLIWPNVSIVSEDLGVATKL